MGKKKKSKDKERPVPDIEARKETAESVKSLGESKTIKCDKCNHIMNFNYNVSIAFYILKIKSYKAGHAPNKYMIKVMKRRRRVMLLLFYFLSGKWTNRF